MDYTNYFGFNNNLPGMAGFSFGFGLNPLNNNYGFGGGNVSNTLPPVTPTVTPPVTPTVTPTVNSGGGGGAPNASNFQNPLGGAIGMGTSLLGAGIGAYEYFRANSALNQLNSTPFPNYTMSPELQKAYGQADAMSNTGFTAGEKGAYQSLINQQGQTAYNRAIAGSGGNFSNIISAGINSNNVQGANQMSIADANLRRSNMDRAAQLAGQLQTQQNQINQGLIQQRYFLQNQWNNAATAGMQSIMNGLVGAGASAIHI